MWSHNQEKKESQIRSNSQTNTYPFISLHVNLYYCNFLVDLKSLSNIIIMLVLRGLTFQFYFYIHIYLGVPCSFVQHNFKFQLNPIFSLKPRKKQRNLADFGSQHNVKHSVTACTIDAVW